jgi:hypothetical protein
MKVGEFARRAPALKTSKKARFEAAFDRAKREVRSLDTTPPFKQVPVPGFAKRPGRDRPILSLPIRRTS